MYIENPKEYKTSSKIPFYPRIYEMMTLFKESYDSDNALVDNKCWF